MRWTILLLEFAAANEFLAHKLLRMGDWELYLLELLTCLDYFANVHFQLKPLGLWDASRDLSIKE